jgi:preprotein translocase subunit SecA
MLVDVVTAYVNGATAEGYAEDWDLEKLWEALKTLYPVGIDHHDLLSSTDVGEAGELTREELLSALVDDAEKAYARREAELEELAGEGAMRQLERNVLLNVVDRKWREHLYEMDYLKEGIGLRAMAQRDPLVEYQREGYDMFTGMLDAVKEESVGFLFNVQVEAAPRPAVAPVDAPEGLAEFAAAAARSGGQQPTTDAPVQPAPSRPAPTALRAKGIDDQAERPMTYSGPAEDGGVAVQRNGGGGTGRPAAANAGGAAASRRQRREAARREARSRKN